MRIADEEITFDTMRYMYLCVKELNYLHRSLQCAGAKKPAGRWHFEVEVALPGEFLRGERRSESGLRQRKIPASPGDFHLTGSAHLSRFYPGLPTSPKQK
ncbi:MAG TPA: hypothetical protein VFU95_13625 [Telluria sp.]|nr:hypothetical protein [Telluria sp.]